MSPAVRNSAAAVQIVILGKSASRSVALNLAVKEVMVNSQRKYVDSAWQEFSAKSARSRYAGSLNIGLGLRV